MTDPDFELLADRIESINLTLIALILFLSDSKPLTVKDAEDLIHILAKDMPAARNKILNQLAKFK